MAAPGMSRGRLQSVAITATHTPASAFGEDIADDAYSVSELSHIEDEKRAKRVKGHPALAGASSSNREAFVRTTLSRGAGGLERLVSLRVGVGWWRWW
nr:hypothetical protein BaRGS_028861 [Batillaria attramentaria]